MTDVPARQVVRQGSSSPAVIAALRRLWGHRDLFAMWTLREIRVRYKQAALGVAWAIIQPAGLALMFSLVFGYLIHVPSDGLPYPLFAYSALVPWTFFATAITQGIPSLVNNMNLVTKAAFPREVLPFGVIAASLFDFFLSVGVFGLMMLAYRAPLRPVLLWLPLLVVIQLALSSGLTLFGAAMNVFYRDIRFVVPLAMQLWMYASPIIYPASLVPAQLQPLYELNPMVGIIESYRNVLARGLPPDWRSLSISAVVSFLLLAIGYWYFKRTEPDFADLI